MNARKKIVLISLVCVFVVSVLCTLAFTLFGLSNVTMNFKNQTTLFSSTELQNQIIEDTNFKYHSCVFFVDKTQYVETLEKNNPYLKVLNIETKFPNKFIIHAIEREAVFALKVSENKYFICDNELKVVDIKDSYVESVNSPILLKGEFTIQNLEAKKGEFLNLGETSNLIKNIPSSLKLNNREIVEQCALFSSVEIKYNLISRPYLICTDHNNFKSEILYADNDLEFKFQSLFASYPKISPEKYNTHKFVVQKNNNNEIICVLTAL